MWRALTIVNSSNVTTTTPGSVVRFTATFTNAGQVPYTGITIATNLLDVVDDAAGNGDRTASVGHADGHRHRGVVDREHPGRREVSS